MYLFIEVAKPFLESASAPDLTFIGFLEHIAQIAGSNAQIIMKPHLC